MTNIGLASVFLDAAGGERSAQAGLTIDRPLWNRGTTKETLIK
jgi:hypothetical protein